MPNLMKTRTQYQKKKSVPKFINYKSAMDKLILFYNATENFVNKIFFYQSVNHNLQFFVSQNFTFLFYFYQERSQDFFLSVIFIFCYAKFITKYNSSLY